MKRHISILAAAIALSLPLHAQTELPSGGSGTIIRNEGFTVSFSNNTNTPEWVAWELTAEEASATQYSRTDEFLPDPRLKDSPVPSDYSRSGYDRGHMAPAADFKWSLTAMEESFRLSNICPQNHVLNEKTWCDLEKQCRTWAKHYDRLWICCGPIYSDDPRTIGREHHVAVPTSFFKVIMKEFKGRVYTIGFIFPNEPVAGPFLDYAVSVDEVEKVTGLDFFTSLDDKVEKAAERLCNPKDWTYYMIPFKYDQ